MFSSPLTTDENTARAPDFLEQLERLIGTSLRPKNGGWQKGKKMKGGILSREFHDYVQFCIMNANLRPRRWVGSIRWLREILIARVAQPVKSKPREFSLCLLE